MKTFEVDVTLDVIQISTEFSAICSVGQRPFNGTIHLAYRPVDEILEFESYETWLLNLCDDQPTTIEQLTSRIFEQLNEILLHDGMLLIMEAETTVHGPVRVVAKERWDV